MRVALKAINGLESVEVSLEQGTATARWKPGNTATLKQMLAAVEKNGFANKGAKVVVAGMVTSVGGKWRMNVSGTKETFELATSDPAVLAALKTGSAAVVTGTIPEPPKGGSPTLINVEKVESP